MRRGLQLVIVIVLAALVFPAGCSRDRRALAPLSDDTFWRLGSSLSEPPGVFAHDENLVSNEALYAEFARLIRRRGGAYVGVGPEQNFSYIARLQPQIAFVVDIRQENRNLHLMYKALFALARDRADFVSRLFGRPRPGGLSDKSSVDELFRAVDGTPPAAPLLEDTKRAVRERLMTEQRFPLGDADLASIDATLNAFFADGPGIRYGRSEPASDTRPTYRTLMTMRDLWGNPQSYLATEGAFAFVKGLHARNLIVPVVGDFAGPHAIRRIGDYLRAEGLTLSAFYASNVEVYLIRDQRRAFCASLEALPYDERTRFIGNRRLLTLKDKLQACARIPPSLPFPEGFGPPRR